MDAIPKNYALRNTGLVELSCDEGTGMTNVIKKLFTNPAAVKRDISFYTCTSKVSPGWVDFVERHKILV